MYPLLIVREEIVCLILLIFLGINARYYKMGKDNGSFQRMLVYAIGHVVFDIITVLTVNNPDKVPAWFNYAAHVVFYLFAILFAHEFFCYVIALSSYEKRIQKAVRIFGFSLLAPHVRLALIPMLTVMVVAECIQIAVPELLITGGAATVVAV